MGCAKHKRQNSQCLLMVTACPGPQEMLSDANPMVVANALAALQVGGSPPSRSQLGGR